MRNFVLLLAMFLALPSAQADERARVPASELIAVAQAALAAKAQDAGVSVRLLPVGRVEDVPLPGAGETDVRARSIVDPWLRPRVAVPVQVYVADRKLASLAVWFSVIAPAQANVYAADYPRGAMAQDVHTNTATIDRARTSGELLAALDAATGQRLRHPVSAGEPVQAGDFETVPAVQAQQTIRIDATRGGVRLSIAGRALADGDVGQTIAVLPAGATQPVRARVISSQVVTLED